MRNAPRSPLGRSKRPPRGHNPAASKPRPFWAPERLNQGNELKCRVQAGRRQQPRRPPATLKPRRAAALSPCTRKPGRFTVPRCSAAPPRATVKTLLRCALIGCYSNWHAAGAGWLEPVQSRLSCRSACLHGLGLLLGVRHVLLLLQAEQAGQAQAEEGVKRDMRRQSTPPPNSVQRAQEELARRPPARCPSMHRCTPVPAPPRAGSRPRRTLGASTVTTSGSGVRGPTLPVGSHSFMMRTLMPRQPWRTTEGAGHA